MYIIEKCAAVGLFKPSNVVNRYENIGQLSDSCNPVCRALFSPCSPVPPATYVNIWTGYVEAGLYILAAVVMVTTAYYAVVELR